MFHPLELTPAQRTKASMYIEIRDAYYHPVSYTHLDVYKRQDRRYQRLASACRGCRAGRLVARPGADPHAGDHLLPLPGEQGVQALSLIHI